MPHQFEVDQGLETLTLTIDLSIIRYVDPNQASQLISMEVLEKKLSQKRSRDMAPKEWFTIHL